MIKSGRNSALAEDREMNELIQKIYFNLDDDQEKV